MNSIKEFVESLDLIKKTHWSIFAMTFGLFVIFILVPLFFTTMSKLITDDISSFIQMGFIISAVCLTVKLTQMYLEKEKWFKIIDSLGDDERAVLQRFALANSPIAEIKNNIDVLQNLFGVGFEIYSVGKLYNGNFREENGRRYCDIMSKVKLENEDVLPYIKAYFK